MMSKASILKCLMKTSQSCCVRGVKTLSEIPGPKSLPVVGTSWKYFPIIGEYDVSQLHEVGRKKLESFGEVVLEDVGGFKAVNVFNPEDIQAVFQSEGKYPRRRSHLALEHYRKQRPHLYNSGGLFPSNGEEWGKLRQSFQQPVSLLQETRLFLPTADRITSKFIDDDINCREDFRDFLPIVSNLNLKLTWAALFGKDSSDTLSETESARLVEATEACNESILTTDNTQFIWKYLKTSTYRHFEKNMEYIESVALKYIDEFKARNSCGTQNTIIGKFLLLSGVDEKDMLAMVIDLLLGGIDTTSYTSCFMLYALSQNPRCQDKLHKEAQSILQKPLDQITSSHLSQLSYTRAVLKETFRMYPISVGTSRFLSQDVLLPSGYALPKGTLVMTQNMIACRREKNFFRALEFLPERWLKNDNLYQEKCHPFLLLPFGHGPRACLARRRAEQNLLLFIIRVFRNYFVQWIGQEELGIATPLINKPDKLVSLKFSLWS